MAEYRNTRFGNTKYSKDKMLDVYMRKEQAKKAKKDEEEEKKKKAQKKTVQPPIAVAPMKGNPALIAKKTVKLPKPPVQPKPFTPPLTTDTQIQQQKQKYAVARANQDYMGMREANVAANKVRASTNRPLYSSAEGDKQHHLNQIKTPVGFKKQEATPYIPDTGKIIGRVVDNTLRALPTVKAGVDMVRRGMYGELPKTFEDVRKKVAQTHYGEAMYGMVQGLSPIDTKKYIGKAQIDENITDSNFFKGGEIAGTMASFMAPYMAAAPAIGTKLLNVPKIANMGKLGQALTKSIATDLAVGLPLNINYAYNKQNLRGEEALKSIGLNTALDVGLGAAMEGVVPLAKLMGFKLKSGKEITSATDVSGLSKAEREEVMTELERLAYESNVRKGKITPDNGTIYGNSFNQSAGELPPPATTASPVSINQKILDDFTNWRKENFGGAYGNLSKGDMIAMKELYQESTGINIDEALLWNMRNKTAVGSREAPFIANQSELAGNRPPVTPREVPPLASGTANNAGPQPNMALFTVKQRKMIEAIEKRSGVKVTFADLPTGVNGTYRNGVITISRTAKNPAMETFKHELTHHIEASGNYKDLADFIVNSSKNLGNDVDAEMKGIIEKYAKAGQNLDANGAAREYVAKYAEEFLFNSEKAIERLARENPNIFVKAYEWIKDTIRKIGASGETKLLVDAQRKYEKVMKTVVGGMDRETQYLFAGEKAKNADMTALEKAKQMDNQGAAQEEINKATGWFKGRDGKWRFEIDDSAMKYNTEIESGKASELIEHKELFKNYPEISGNGVNKRSLDNINGTYNPVTKEIEVSSKLPPEKQKRVAAHEVQHAIQDIEGFERGANIDTAITEVRANKLTELLTKNNLIITKLVDAGEVEKIKRYIDSELMREYNVSTLRELREKAYSSMHGEKEAQAVSDRIGLTAQERKDNFQDYGRNSTLRGEEYGKKNTKHQTIVQQMESVQPLQRGVREGKNGAGLVEPHTKAKADSKESAFLVQQSQGPKLSELGNYDNMLKLKEQEKMIGGKRVATDHLNNSGKSIGKVGKLYSKLVDNQFALKNISEDTKILGSNTSKVQGAGKYSIEQGLVDMGGKDISARFSDGSKASPKKIFEIAETHNLQDFEDYLLNKHNVARYKEGKAIFGDEITAEMSSKVVADYEKKYPIFKELSDAIADNNKALVRNWLVDGNLFSKEQAEKLLKMYPDYVPTYREGGKAVNGWNAKTIRAATMVKTATGGNKPIVAPHITLAIQMQKTIKAVRQNEVYLSMLEAVRKDPEKMRGIVGLAEDTASVKEANTILKNNIENVRENNGLDTIDEMMSGLLGQDEFGKYYVTALEKGKPIRMTVDEEIYNALLTLNKTGDEEIASKVVNAVNKFMTKPFKSVVTGYNPFFGIRNILRDIPTAYIQGTVDNPIKFIENLGDAVVKMAKNDPIWQEYVALGGKTSGYFNMERGLTSDKLPTKAIKKVGEGISWFNEATEAVPRFGEYLGTLKREAGNSEEALKSVNYKTKQKALYNSGEVTTNFGRFGEVTKFVDKFTPYLNPAVQGIDKSIRTMARPQAWAKGIGALTVPTVGIYLWNQKVAKGYYDKLDNRTKDNNYLFYIPGSEGKFVKIPKSRESGVVFAVLAERMLRSIGGDKEAFKDFGNTVATNFAPQSPLTNNILAPKMYYLPRNKDFANRTIVPDGMKSDPKWLQYDEKTSEVSKWLGSASKAFGINKGEGWSPKELDYIIDSYTGIIGDILLPATTKGGNVAQKVLTGPFTADVTYNNSIQNNFYEKFDKATKEENEKQILDQTPSEYITPGEKRIAVYREASAAMAELRKQEKGIGQQPNTKEKEEALKRLRKQINQIALETPEKAEKAFREYSKTYIPEISELSDKQQAGYRKYAEPAKVSPADFSAANKETKVQLTALGKTLTVLKKYPDNGEAIAKGLGYNDSSIKTAKAFSELGISAKQYETYRKTGDINKDGKIDVMEVHKLLDDENLTPIQRVYLMNALKGASALKEKKK